MMVVGVYTVLFTVMVVAGDAITCPAIFSII